MPVIVIKYFFDVNIVILFEFLFVICIKFIIPFLVGKLRNIIDECDKMRVSYFRQFLALL